jgi:hypothetical protein
MMTLLLSAACSVLFTVLCVVSYQLVQQTSRAEKAEEDAEALRRELKTAPNFDYDRLAAAMARHSMTLAELHASREKRR